MSELGKEFIGLLKQSLGSGAIYALMLAAALIYIWYQHHRLKLLQERGDLLDEHRKLATEEFERRTKALNEGKIISEYSKPALPFVFRPKLATVLVVDDERLIWGIMESMLGEMFGKVTVYKAFDGQEAIEQLENNRPNLIILDIAMPRKSGYDVLDELAKRDEKIPTIICSGYVRNAQMFARPDLLRRQSLVFLPKPFTLDELLSAITAVLATEKRF